MSLDLLTKRVNKRRYLDINYGLHQTKTFIVELGFLGVYSDEDQR